MFMHDYFLCDNDVGMRFGTQSMSTHPDPLDQLRRSHTDVATASWRVTRG